MIKTPHYWVALSGGRDSIVLLHFLKTYFPHYPLSALHINHQLLPEAILFEQHCKKLCEQLSIPLEIVRVNIEKKSGESLEAKAREARYAVFKKILKENDFLFMAHHEDDQAETLLLQLFRGAGLRGVSSMPAIAPLGKGYLLRPFLNFTRKDLENYAQEHQLNFCEDPSNADENFDRNFLRHQVFPALKTRWPKIEKTLSHFALHCAEQEKLLSSLAKKDFEKAHKKTGNITTINISKFKKLSEPRQKNVLRYLLKKLALDSANQKILEQILQMAQAREDKIPLVKWKNTECRRYKNSLYFFSCLKKRSAELTTEEKIWCEKYLNINLTDKNISISFRQGGEIFKPANSLHTRTLKKLFQEWEIPPWLRDQIPLIYKGKVIIAVVGYAVGEG